MKTLQAIRLLSTVKKRGWLRKEELIAVCYWKSPRAIRLVESNHPLTVKKITQSVFTTKSEEDRMYFLLQLRGVSVPMASAILMLTDPKRYGVIDIRVWEILCETGDVTSNKKGINFKFEEWHQVLVILRQYSKKLKVSARTIERTIFQVHKKHQDGLLYKNINVKK